MAVIYGAYFDESDEKPGFAVGGYSASYQTWIHLDWAWQCLCKRWGIEYFKASECENLMGQFAQYRKDPSDVKTPLSKEEHGKVVEIKTQFVDALCKHSDDLQGYGAVVVSADFERIVRENPRAARLFMDKPYYICAQLCLTAATMPALDWNTRHGLDERVRVKPIFDSHTEYSVLAKPMYDKYLKKNPRCASILLPLDFESDIETSALQAADSFVYEVRKLLSRQITRPGDDYVRPPMQRFKPFTYRVYRLDYDALKLILARQKPDSIPIKNLKVKELWYGEPYDANAKSETPQ